VSDKLSDEGKQAFEEYEALYLEIESKAIRLVKLEEAIKKEVLNAGECLQHGHVKASYKRGYTRVHWDPNGLDKYAVDHPKVLEWREERPVKPNVSVTVFIRDGEIRWKTDCK